MSKRAAHRAMRTRVFWAAKLAAANTPAEQAAVAWDRVRSLVADLPAAERDRAWTQIRHHLEQLGPTFAAHPR